MRDLYLVLLINYFRVFNLKTENRFFKQLDSSHFFESFFRLRAVIRILTYFCAAYLSTSHGWGWCYSDIDWLFPSSHRKL